MTSDDRSFLNWLSMAFAVAALVLGFFALGRVGSSGEQAAGAGGGGVESSIIEMDLGALVFEPQHVMAPPGEVTIRVEKDGRVYIGRGASTDIIVASAKAYLSAINRILAYEGISDLPAVGTTP